MFNKTKVTQLIKPLILAFRIDILNLLKYRLTKVCTMQNGAKNMMYLERNVLRNNIYIYIKTVWSGDLMCQSLDKEDLKHCREGHAIHVKSF